MLAAALAQLGRLDEARSAVKAGLALNPAFAISRARAALDGDERRPDVSGPARAHSRRPCARPESPSNDRDPPPRRDHGRRRRRLLAPDGRGRGGDGAGVREHREAARPIVAGLGGRIVKTMGDGLLLEFPSVVAAVECAIAIQKLMAERNADVARGQAHRLSHRRQSRRRADRGRRHSRRRRQHRGAAGRRFASRAAC